MAKREIGLIYVYIEKYHKFTALCTMCWAYSELRKYI
jgi:hypothetical protein